MIRRPPRSTLFPTRRSSDLHEVAAGPCDERRRGGGVGVRERQRRDRVRGERRAGVEAEPAEPQQRSEEHTSELQSRLHLVCRLLLEKKKKAGRTSGHLARGR